MNVCLVEKERFMMKDEEINKCSYGEEDCTGDEDNDYDMMCDDHRREYGENIADMRNDLD